MGDDSENHTRYYSVRQAGPLDMPEQLAWKESAHDDPRLAAR
jgi:hypothetical protein